MSKARNVGLAAGILVLVVFGAHADPCAEDPANGARVEITVDWSAGEIAVDPASVEIFLSEGEGKVNRVCWVITGLEQGQTLSIEGKPDQEEVFPSMEKTIKGPKSTANSGKPNKAGTWAYQVTAVVEETGDQLNLDPEVIIRP